jgi:hypothetical protein
LALKKFCTVTIAAIALVGILTTLITLSALSASRTVPASGTMTAVNVELYSDAACTQICTTLNFGTLDPGSTVTQNVYIKNTGAVPVTLSMAVNNWNPTNAGSCETLSWNRGNYVLNAGLSVQATLTLTAASNTGSLTTFSFSVTITGTQ